MKKIISLISLFILLSLVFVSIIIYGSTAHFYYTIFKDGVDSEYINISASKNNILLGEEIEISSEEIHRSIWKTTHLKNFNIPVPFSHPLIYVVPHAEYKYDRSELGFSFQSMSGAEIFRFYEEKSELFKTEIDRNKLFSIPIIRNIIFDKSQKQIFKDLFSRDIFFGNRKVPDLSQGLFKSILFSDWKNLIYNLFIYKLRIKYFDFSNIENLFWDNQHSIGIISFKSDKTGDKNELLYFLHDGIIYKMRISYKEWNAQSKKIKSLVITNLEFLKSVEEASISIYADYRSLSYKQQIGHDGMIFLFSAWSHHPDDQKFLKEMIHRLERGKEANEQLRILYKYSLNKFKRTFSSKEEIRHEDSLTNKINDNVQAELKNAQDKEEKEMKNYQEMEELEFNSADEKMDYYLDEALRKEE